MSLNFNHFLQRVKERYDVDLTLKDLEEIATNIKIGKAKLTKANAKSYHYKVRCNKKLLIVVINRSHSFFITALPIQQNTCRVRFNNIEYSYEDALYFNWLYNKQFNKVDNKVVCSKCGSNSIAIDLGKNRFRCEDCGHIVKFKENLKINPLLLIVNKSKFEQILDLSEDFWWFLYKNKKSYTFKNIEISAVLRDYDNKRYIIKYDNKNVDIQQGIYTEKRLKEMLNE